MNIGSISLILVVHELVDNDGAFGKTESYDDQTA